MRKIKILKFANRGQGFLIWELDSSGKVVFSKPHRQIRAPHWVGGFVENHKRIKRGDRAQFSRSGLVGRIEINYPIIDVRTRPAKFVIECPNKPKRWLAVRSSPGSNGLTSKFEMTTDLMRAKTFSTIKAAQRLKASFGSFSDRIVEL